MFSLLSFLFFLLQKWKRVKQILNGGREAVVTSERGEVRGKGDRKVITVQNCVHMYVNAKMIPVKTTPGIRERGG
jgi:hypothetical protein